jgi:hypothetical protein
MKLRHIQPGIASDRQCARPLETIPSGISTQDHHTFRPPEPTVLEGTAQDQLLRCKGSTHALRVQL